MIVAIDGPAGSGKSTTARRAADTLGYVHIDTGAMYRAVTLRALQDGVDIADDDALTACAMEVSIDLRRGDEGPRVYLDGEDVSEGIRTSEVDLRVSRVSEVAALREEIVRQQRELAANRDAVMEGRDIGTVVFPDAEVKVYLVATVQERAKRRQKELALRGIRHDLADVLADLERRDQHDSTRALAPLKPAPDAVWLDTTELTIEEQVQRVVELARERSSGEVGT